MVIYEIWMDYSWLAFSSKDEKEAIKFFNSSDPTRRSLWVKDDMGNVLMINGVRVA